MAVPAITQARQHLAEIVEDTFSTENVPVRSDKMDDSLGQTGPVAAVYPEIEAPSDTGVVQGMRIVIQVFRKYDAQIDPEQRVDPALIEEWAWRLMNALRDADQPNTDQVSYYNVLLVDYMDDPTGNKSRFEMTLEAFGPNVTVHETTA